MITTGWVSHPVKYYVMKRFIGIAVVTLLLAKGILHAQGREQNIWTFGQYDYSLDFSTTPPTLRDRSTPVNGLPSGVSNDNSISVCDAMGNRLFTVRVHRSSNGNTPAFYDRYNNPIAGAVLLPGSGAGSTLEQMPLIVPHPGNASQYFVFYGRNGGLLCTLFDMSLNGGLGDVVQGQTNILVAGYNTVACEAMTTVQSCTGVWLIVRERQSTGFLSYHIDRNGLHTVPVRSVSNLLPREYFELVGHLKASPDGRMIAATFQTAYNIPLSYHVPGGVVVYGFEPCSGRLINERVLDWEHSIEGVCFSPDNSKLYITQNDTVQVRGIDVIREGKLFQFDLGLQAWVDVQNSKTLLLINPWAYRNTIFCPYEPCQLGDIKIGPDGKLYLLNNHPSVCTGTAMAFHVIHNPNAAGMASLPEINAIYNTQNGMFNRAGIGLKVSLPRDIVQAPLNLSDTIAGNVYNLSACFADNMQLSALDGKSCYRWDDGCSTQQRTVYFPGTYWVSYFEGCTIVVDTYHVEFVPIPEVRPLYYGCDGDISVTVEYQNECEYELFRYGSNNRISSVKSHSFTVNGLYAGEYSLRIKASPICDTIIKIQLISYPKPDLTVSPQDTTIRYGERVTLHADGARLYTWWPVASLDTSITGSPLASPLETTKYIVTGINDYGCRDTAHIVVNINHTKPYLLPNAFTPNGDGLNDIFHIEGIADKEIRLFEVYNRYGELMHAEYRSNKGWDGTYKGKPCDAGTYFYMLETDGTDGSSNRFKGDITLLR